MIKYIQDFFHKKSLKNKAESRNHLKWEIKAIAEKATGRQMSMHFVDMTSEMFTFLKCGSGVKIIEGEKVHNQTIGFVYLSSTDISCFICEPSIFVDGKKIKEGKPMVENIPQGITVLAYFHDDDLFMDSDAIESIIEK